MRDGGGTGVGDIEEVADEPRVTRDDGGNGEDDERKRHDERGFFGPGGMVTARLAEENDE